MRRRRAEKRKVVGDPKYNSDLVSRFIAILMVDGKKTIAEKTSKLKPGMAKFS